ncbi:MAG TPA: Calx-beta domain-containing protein [Gemmatales bacterium]|nr:Calx-beta domain-containing protein [Gemmatales bacterium]
MAVAHFPVRLHLEPLEDRTLPSAVPVAWFQHGSGGGGALYSPSIGLANADEVYIASDMSNLFRSTDFGASFATVSHLQVQGNHYAKVQFTNDPHIRYSLDYTTVAGLDLRRPTKTTDGGATWTPLASDPTSGAAYTLFADPANADRVIVTSYTRLYFSNNGGASFSEKYMTSNTNTGLHVGGVFFDGTSIYVGTNFGLLTSTNGGSTFTMNALTGVPAGQGILSMAGARNGATARLFAVTATAANVYAGITGADFGIYGGVYTLDLGSGSWVNRSAGIPAGTFPFFVGAALNDVNTVYVGGGSNAGAPIVYKSTTAGAAWQNVFLTTNNQNIQTGWQGHGGDRGWGYGEYVLGLAVAPGDSSRAIITDLGAAHGTTDGGALWRALYVHPDDLNPAGQSTGTGKNYRSSGLDNTTSWQVYWADANTMLIANSDVRGQRSTNAGQSWNFGYTGHTENSMYRIVKHNTQSTLYAATSTVHDLYQTTYLQDSRIDNGGGRVLFSTNNGQSWQVLHNFGNPVVWVATDPTNLDRLYAAVVNSTAGGIYVTNNLSAGASSTWTKLTNPPRTEGHPFNILVLADGSLVVTYCGRRNSGGAFTASSGVFLSTDGGTSWLDRSHANMLYYTKDLVIDPADATQSTWYVGVWSGWGGPPNNLGGLYRTTDKGLSWTRLTTHHRVTALAIDPSNPIQAYLTTETEGLWYTTNLSAVSPAFTRIDTFPFRQAERVFFNPHNANEIWVNTFGGGVWRGVFSTAPGTLAPTAPTITVAENIGTLIITFVRTAGSFGTVSIDYSTYSSPFPNAATPGQDYVAQSGTLVFGPNDTVKSVAIPIINDSNPEALEVFGVALRSPSSGVQLLYKSISIWIEDDDGPAPMGLTPDRSAALGLEPTTTDPQAAPPGAPGPTRADDWNLASPLSRFALVAPPPLSRSDAVADRALLAALMARRAAHRWLLADLVLDSWRRALPLTERGSPARFC